MKKRKDCGKKPPHKGNSDDLLTETDKYNIEIIKSYENR